MNIAISFIIIFLFIIACYIAIKHKYNQIGISIALILIGADLIAHFSVPEYNGLDLNNFSTPIMANIAVIFYYLGYHLISIIGLIVAYFSCFIFYKKSIKEKNNANAQNLNNKNTNIIGEDYLQNNFKSQGTTIHFNDLRIANFNTSSNIVSQKDFVNIFSEKTGLPQNICIDIYYITLNFNNKDKDLAYNLIESKLIPDLKQNNSIAQVGIAFGTLIQENLCLTKEEADNYSKKVIYEMVNLNGIN